METYSTRQVAAMTGASYRQCWRWASEGYILGLKPRGTGHPMRWTPEQLQAARDIKGRMDVRRLLTLSSSHVQSDDQEAPAMSA